MKANFKRKYEHKTDYLKPMKITTNKSTVTIKQPTHKIGKHGAIGIDRPKGYICAECLLPFQKKLLKQNKGKVLIAPQTDKTTGKMKYTTKYFKLEQTDKTTWEEKLRLHKEVILWKQDARIKGLTKRYMYDADFIEQFIAEELENVRQEVITNLGELCKKSMTLAENKALDAYRGDLKKKLVEYHKKHDRTFCSCLDIMTLIKEEK